MSDREAHVTPGQLISELLEKRGWAQQTLAIVLKMDKASVAKILLGKKPVTAEMALDLGAVFGVDPADFLHLQKKYELARAQLIARPDPGLARRAHLFGDLPVAHMIKRGWLPGVEDTSDLPRVERALTRFFNAKSLDEIEVLPAAAKRTNVIGDFSPPQLAWLYRVKSIANEMMVASYSPAAVAGTVPKLKALLASAEEARKVPRILAEAGIRFVIVESLPSAKIDGVCFWLDDGPVIGMTLRHDRIDNFWFVLRHELEHVLLGHGRESHAAMLDTDLEGSRAGIGPDVSEDERLANAAAADFCVPQRKLEGFIARKAPFFAERDILGFARTEQLHPGLVAGQIQHRTGRYDRFRTHQVKIRSIVRPGAMVDGWGDVAPTEL